jgi:HAD superfamily hydrolase (TIGR01549 family)
MFMDLLRHGGAPGRYERLKILYHFRRMREELAMEAPRDFEEPLFSRLASLTGHPKAVLIDLVEEWVEQKPLIHLKAAMVAGARDFIKTLRENGVDVAVWSDYRVQAKLKTLDITVDHMLTASDDDVNALKPDPTGLCLAMDRAGVGPSATLMVGDRMSRDGVAAAAANVDFLLRSDKAPKQLTERQFHVRDYRAFRSSGSQLAEDALAV